MIDIFVNLLINTDDVAHAELTEQEEEEVAVIMKHPEVKKYLGKNTDLNQSILSRECFVWLKPRS